MHNYKVSKLDEELKDLTNAYSTNYDHLFDNIIKERGISYNRMNLIHNVNKNGNIYEAVVEGTYNYNVKVEIKKDKLINIYCDCPYHKKNTYCKHIYAFLYYINVLESKEDIKALIKENLDTMNNIIKEEEMLLEKHSKIILKNDRKIILNEIDYMKESVSRLRLNDEDFIHLRCSLFDLCNYLEHFIMRYEEFIDYIKRRYDEIEERKLEREEAKRQRALEKWEDENEYYDENDPLIKSLDNYIASLPLDLLEKVRIQNIKDNFDNDIIDKAIKTKKENLRKQKEEEKALKKAKRGSFFAAIGNLLSSSNKKSSDDLFGYESYQYEEEEKEEDDYHYDDLD